MKNLGRILHIVLAMDFALFVLSFIPAVSGIGPEPGLFDRLWGSIRFAGWRADVLWICASTIFIVVGGLKYVIRRRSGKTTAALCGVWLVCFLFYVRYTVRHMFG